MAAAFQVPGGQMNVLTRLLKFLTLMLLLGPAMAQAADQSVWPLTPYRITVFVAVASDAPLTARLEKTLLTDLTARIEAVVGAPWNVTLSPPPPGLRGAMLYDMQSLQVGDVTPFATSSPEPDKLLLVAVTAAPGGLTVVARDFDVHTRVLNTPVTRRVWQIGSLCDSAMDAILTAFCPLARIDRLERENKDNIAVLRVKAAGLPTRDKNLMLLQPGDVFRPVVRSNNRDGKFLKSVQARWSLLLVEKIAPEEVRSRVHTGNRGEIPAKGRGRAESLAMRVISPGGATTITLQARIEPKIPLAGCDIYAYPPNKKDAVALIGQTDRQGRFSVPASKDSLMRVLLVKNGSSLLAKLPLVPGLDPALTAELPNDDQRLEAEGFINCVQEEILDLVARQKILSIRIHAKIEAKDFDKATELLDELRRLPTQQSFDLRLTRAQEKFTTKDSVIQKKLNTLFSDTRKMIEQHIEAHLVEELDRELRDAKLDAKSVVEK
jgi:hypothetical protein